MTRLVLRSLNAPLLVLMVIIGIALQTSLFAWWPLQFLQPDVVLLTVIWCALNRGFTEGGVITLICAYMAELHSAAPQGFFMTTYMAVYLLLRGAERVLVLPKAGPYVFLTFSCSLLWKLLGLGFLYLLGASANQWQHTMLLLFPGALVEMAAGIWVYRWLERFDWVTFKDPRAAQQLEDELQLDAEGF